MPKQLDTKIFLERVQAKNSEMFDQYDYSKTVYVNLSTKVIVTCRAHGNFNVWPGDQNMLTHLWELDYKTQETIEANTRFMLPVWATLEHLKNEKDKD